MVVNDFDIPGIPIPPIKADPPLIVHPDAPLAFAIAVKSFQPVSGRLSKFCNPIHAINLPEFPECDPLNRGEPAAMKTLEESLGSPIRKGLDHAPERSTFNA